MANTHQMFNRSIDFVIQNGELLKKYFSDTSFDEMDRRRMWKLLSNICDCVKSNVEFMEYIAEYEQKRIEADTVVVEEIVVA